MIRSGSLKRGLLLVTMVVTTLTSLTVFSIFSAIQYHELRALLVERLEQHALLLATNVKQQITHHDDDWHDSYLEALIDADFVQTVHLYRYAEDDAELSFFSSYNRAGMSAIPSRLDQISQLEEVEIRQYSAEIAVPLVTGNDEQLGYLFVRASISELHRHIQVSMLSAFGLVLITLIITFIATSLLSRYFTRPLNRIITTMQQVARTKDYSLRVKSSELVELDMLAHNFNTMLDRVQQYLRQQRKAESYAHQLNSELEQQVQDRTNALRNANQELLDTLEQLHQHQGRQVEAQKMSSLSELVAGISHEVNTPIGLAITSGSMLQEKLAALDARMQSEELTSNELQQFLQTATENATMVNRNLRRAADLVDNFKMLAIEHAGEDPTDVDLQALFEDIIASCLATLNASQHIHSAVHCDFADPVSVKVGVWQQILASLLENSVIHGFAQRDEGHVEISITRHLDRLRVTYKDDGCGVPADILRRIFDPFVTSKRGSGNSGLGMHLIYNLVSHTLDGSIRCHSQPDQGFEVVIECPLDITN
ncbi:ATP-binding protein [Aliidiomarina sp. Khilg15.8]